tara:strand:- start:894 stop:1040 length:147 start_codon:yes stop_codon:yes gene_type:complete
MEVILKRLFLGKHTYFPVLITFYKTPEFAQEASKDVLRLLAELEKSKI